jgi:hypothetical protein
MFSSGNFKANRNIAQYLQGLNFCQLIVADKTDIKNLLSATLNVDIK